MRGHTRQQKRSHGKKGRVPRYMNENKFKHNTKSKKSERIMALSHNGLCHRCHDKIEWKKKYRKYKPLKRSGKCYICEQPKVKRAYHTICDDCGKERNCCVWCKLDFNKDGNKAKVTREEREEMARREREAFEAEIAGLNERDKRTMRRRRQREEEGDERDNSEDSEDEGRGLSNREQNDDSAVAAASAKIVSAAAVIGTSSAQSSATDSIKKATPATSKMERLKKLKESRAKAKAEQLAENPPSSLLDMAARASGCGAQAVE